MDLYDNEEGKNLLEFHKKVEKKMDEEKKSVKEKDVFVGWKHKNNKNKKKK